ncbi:MULTISPECIES: hypothetical protein [unclassified Legionella]|uniref:hypothetical protein n=1 Tax=unclassified Legionella TaxID=2622702 RepID=UPI001055733E|nr:MULTISPECIES: hypothetical protein [unclassified Legionella]MDI9819063.1 hypothetical protein [Legionella sp. PL877]
MGDQTAKFKSLLATSKEVDDGLIFEGQEIRKQRLLQGLQSMQQKPDFKPQPLSENSVFLALLNKVPLLSGFLRNIDNSGKSLSKLAIVHGHVTHATKVAGSGFQWGSLGLAIIDFVRIPIIYLAASLLRSEGQKSPITLSRNARLLYSSVLLGLTITAIAVPALAAPIAVVAASLGFATSVFLLGKHFYDRAQLKKALNKIPAEIADKEAELTDLQVKAAGLERTIKEGNANFNEMETEFKDLEQRFRAKAKEIQELYDKQLHLQQKLEKMNSGKVADRCMAIGLSALAVIGVGLALAFPPIGLGIVAGSAVLGGAYVIGRLALPLVSKFAGWLKTTLFKDPDKVQESAKDEVKEKLEAGPVLDNTMKVAHVHETTTDLSRVFTSDDINAAVKALSEQIAESQSIEQFIEQIGKRFSAIKPENLQGIVNCFKDIAAYAKEHQLNAEDLQGFLEMDKVKPGLALLQRAITETGFSPEEQKEILDYSPLAEALEKQGVDFKPLKSSPTGSSFPAMSSKKEEEEEEGENEGRMPKIN